MTTWQEKREIRFQTWLNPVNVNFVSEEAKKLYQERAQLLIDAVELKKTPKRVPLYPNHGHFPNHIYGVTPYETLTDMEKNKDVTNRFIKEFPFDVISTSNLRNTIPAFEMLDYQLYKWSGHGIPKSSGHQYVEKVWLETEDYPMLINDPSNFWLRKYMPRIIGKLKGLEKLPTATALVEFPSFTGFFSAFADPQLRESLQALLDVGPVAKKWTDDINTYVRSLMAEGHPENYGSGAKAPFDTISDTLRDTRTALTDIRRNPEALLEAMERLIPITSQNAIDAANRSGNPFVFMPLHKGADGFMSPDQYEKFYWPQLKKVMENLIEAGCVPAPFAEGGFNQRLEYIKDLPKGSTAWMFDTTDIFKLKKMLGDHICIVGNVPGSLIHSATPEDVEKYTLKLIEEVAPGGGYMMATGTVLSEGKAENLQAMVQTTLKHGTY